MAVVEDKPKDLEEAHFKEVAVASHQEEEVALHLEAEELHRLLDRSTQTINDTIACLRLPSPAFALLATRMPLSTSVTSFSHSGLSG